MSTRVLRACDGCRVRKVRCNGQHPCSQCAHLNLACKFAPPPAKRKPGVRGRLVAQLRNNQAQEHTTGTSTGSNKTSPLTVAASSPRSSDASPPAVTSIAGIVNSDPYAETAHHTPASSSSLPTTPLPVAATAGNTAPSPHHTIRYFLAYLDLYEEQIYPVNPVLSCDEMRAAVRNMDVSLQDRALVYASTAVTINLTQTLLTSATDTLTEIATLMNLSIAVHRQAETRLDNSTAWTRPDAGPSAASVKFGELPVNFKRIMTCVFLEICMMAFKRWDRSFMLLREAITMIQVLNVQQYDAAMPFDGSLIDGFDAPADAATSPDPLRNNNYNKNAAEATVHAGMRPRDVFRLRRVYWELFIHERFLSTVTGFPCAQLALADVPLHDPTIPAHVDLGFNRLANLFRVLDGPFLAHWTAHKDPTTLHHVPAMTAQWVESKQAELDRDEDGAAAAEQRLAVQLRNNTTTATGPAGFTEVQHVDLFITRVWLRTLVWQFALHHGLLRSAPPRSAHEGLSLHFPAQRLSAQLRALVDRLGSFSSVLTHGSGILHKLFEITSTVADVLALPRGPGQTEEGARARLQDFEFLVRFLFTFERIEKSQRDYLREKLGVLGRQYTIVDFAGLAGESPNA
ncbi:C6 transcription factor [Cordyceps fumosorosea ARSEF 2679]|uniref:C6 transcription factor n=1 Tax=Cordyceps fumosorosea (strain ARSEF 2679) TaxID=1081104 RepID=A0A167HJE8_CORFA|nr:C6 transcription factor [Cordyceps fumosorosea ARSEF 2679]OAA47982.1 C6 transcription factor [Cordyceps fumosorosea ARSEF 2679]